METTWMDLKNIKVQRARHKRVYTIQFHLCETLGKTNQINSERKEQPLSGTRKGSEN